MTHITTSMGTAARLLRCVHGIIVCFMLASPAFAAQPVGVPPACADKSGAELDQCVRAATMPQFNITPVEQPVAPTPRSSRLVLCANVVLADKRLCVEHNQVVIDCQKATRTAEELRTCISPALERLPKPIAANCAKEKTKALAALCPVRNKYFKTCGADPVNYFKCLEERYQKK